MTKLSDKYNVNTHTNIRLGLVYKDKAFQDIAKGFKSHLLDFLLAKDFIKSPKDFTHCSKAVLVEIFEQKMVDEYDAIIEKYSLKDSELWAYLDLSAVAVKDSAIDISTEADTDYVTVNIHPWAKKQDLVNSWSKIEAILKSRKGYVKRHRSPKDIKLVYAVKKARDDGMSFSQIANAINNNNFDDYERAKDGKNDWDQWSIADYYGRYKHIVVK